jgi:hypothetical protein
MVNFLLYGTSFTRQPRITEKSLEEAQKNDAASIGRVILARAEDLVRAVSNAGRNDRVLLVRRLMESRGYRFPDPSGRETLMAYVLANVSRVLKEQRDFTRTIATAQELGDATEEFIRRSKLYQDRGLSLDTSFRPNFAIERALIEIKQRGLLVDIKRVAVIGPGLDFADKQSGYDYYPQQTLQPFALIDSLRKLGLAPGDGPHVTVFDISDRPLEHLAAARRRAQGGAGYILQTPLERNVSWKPDTIGYWSNFGESIGQPVPPIVPPSTAGNLRLRAVRARPAVVSLLEPVNLNIVLQHMEMPGKQGFDLIVATNILLYYGELEQALALKNVELMLRPGGMLLTNNVLLELPSSRMRSIGNSVVEYSERPNDGDHIVWYRRED